jgi:hypothetical protein
MDAVQALITPILMVFLAVVGGCLLKERLDGFEARLVRIEDRLNAAPTRAEFGRLEERLDASPTRVEFDPLRAEVERLRETVDVLRGAVDGLHSAVDVLRGEVNAMRSDLTQIALAVGARVHPQTG